MKILFKTQISNKDYALKVLDALRKNRIGHAGCAETYGNCYVRKYHDGEKVKGTFTGGFVDADGNISFRVRTSEGVGRGYLESNYDLDEIEFIKE